MDPRYWYEFNPRLGRSHHSFHRYQGGSRYTYGRYVNPNAPNMPFLLTSTGACNPAGANPTQDYIKTTDCLRDPKCRARFLDGRITNKEIDHFGELQIVKEYMNMMKMMGKDPMSDEGFASMFKTLNGNYNLDARGKKINGKVCLVCHAK
jgi:hypothetical protein